jgi:hypothetical protein
MCQEVFVGVELDRPEEVTAIKAFYTETMVRQAVREFMVRRVLKRWEFWVLEVVLIGWAIYLRQDQQVFWAGILAGVSVLPILLVLAVWRAHWVNTVGKFRRMRSPEATFTFDEKNLVVQSFEGEAKVPLGSIVEVWKLKDFWMLFFATNSFMTLPIGQLDGQGMKMLEARLPVSK